MKQCRICLEEYDEFDSDIDDLISPCHCDGTQKYVHSKCLEKWRGDNTDSINNKRCQECLTFYQLEIIGNKSISFRIKKIIVRFFYYVTAKFDLLVLVSNFFIFYGIGYLLFLLNLTSFEIIETLYGNNYLLKLPIIGSLVFQVCGLFFYNFLIFYIYSNKKNINWISSNNINVKRLTSIIGFNIIVLICFPILGLIFSIFCTKFINTFFFEYFLSKYIIDKTKALHLENELEEALIP